MTELLAFIDSHLYLSTFWLFMVCCAVACIGGSR